MIWPTDATRLAFTKLKTRKTRLIITLIVSSLLFCLLVTISTVVRGTIGSVEKFSSSGFGNRYLVQARSNISAFDNISNPELIAKAENMQKQLVEKKKLEAKRLNIEYDPKSEPTYASSGLGPEGKILDATRPEVLKLLEDYSNGALGKTVSFDQVAKQYKAINTYKGTSIGGSTFTIPYITVLQENKEDFNLVNQQQNKSVTGFESLPTQWQLLSSELIKPFLLNGQNMKTGSDGSIPVIAPISSAEKLLKLKSLPASASSEVRLERLKYVREHAAGLTFSICYRNSISANRLEEAKTQQKDLEDNKTNKDYQKPSLIHGLPAAACQDVTTTRDVRSAEDKLNDSKQEQFRRTFGEKPPESFVVKLRLVGLNADITGGSNAINVTQIFQAVLTSTLGFGWFSPLESADDNNKLATVFNLSDSTIVQSTTFYAEFSGPSDIRKILDEQNCEPDYGRVPSSPDKIIDPLAECKKQHKYFTVSPYGSSSTAISDLKKTFSKVFKILALVVAILASLIMMGMVGRIIADSRRETAVFRAIGAKRIDIWQVYLTYAVMVAGLIAFVSFVFGNIAAQYINQRYSESFTVAAALSFNIQDLSQRFSLYGSYMKDLLYVWGIILAAAVLAAIIPLLTNVRRNPIRDMRDDQ